MEEFDAVVLVYINTMKTTFDLNFWFIQSFFTSWIHINMQTTSLCLLLKFSFEKNLVANENLNRKDGFIALT